MEQIEPFYPKGDLGRPPSGSERMLHMYIVQQCFDLADEATEDASLRLTILGRIH